MSSIAARWWFGLALVASVTTSFADEKIRFISYGIEEGLQFTGVHSVLEEESGFVWIGTSGGLLRFDGYRFEPFPLGGDPIEQGDIRSLVRGHDGRLWVGSSRGIGVIDPATEKVHWGPSELDVRTLFEDRRGTLWLGTKQGLYWLTADVLKGETPWLEPPELAVEALGVDLPGLDGPTVYALAEDRAGQLWVGTRVGLYRLKPGGELDLFQNAVSLETSLHDDEIYALLVDREGSLWIGTWGSGGLGRLRADELELEHPSFQRFQYPKGDPRGPVGEVVRALHEDESGALWVGTHYAGISYLTPAERSQLEPRFVTLGHDPNDATTLNFFSVKAIASGADGVWVGTENGLSYHATTTEAVGVYRPDPIDDGTAIVSTALETRDGALWLGNRDGLRRVTLGPDGRTVDARRIRLGEDGRDNSVDDSVLDLLEDKQGSVWVATNQGLNRIESVAPLRFERYPPFEHGLETRAVMTLFEARDGTLWAGGYRGLFRLDEGSNQFLGYFHDPDELTTLSANLVYSLAEDLTGRLWIGTEEGLDRFDPGRGTVERSPLGLGSTVYDLAVAPNGTVWAATISHGLLSIDPQTDAYRVWPLPVVGSSDPCCSAVALDEAGFVWVVGDLTLRRLDPKSGSSRIFDRRDGFALVPFGPRSLELGPDGEFSLPGAKGVARFRAEELATSRPFDAPVVLRGLRLANKPVAVAAGGRLPKALVALDELVLQPEDRMVSFEFAALDFQGADRIRYEYRLAGFDDEWVATDSSQRIATFTQVTPGEYRFEVRAVDAQGRYSPHQASLAVRFLPRWYQTRFFRWSFLSLVLGLPLLAAWWWVRRTEARRRALQVVVDRLEEEKRQRRHWQELSVAASGLAHETKNPLGIIRGLAQRLAQSPDLGPDGRQQVEMILDQSDRAASRLGEFLTYARERQPRLAPVHLAEMTQKILFVLGEDLEAAAVPVTVEVGTAVVEADEEMLVQILINLVLNSLEASDAADPLSISFEVRGTHGVLRVEDHGRGIPADLLEEIRKPYVSGSEMGHGLGLAIVERLTQGQGWTLHLTSEEGRGTVVELAGMRVL
jgi:ligand-binding sensor domain-containing protein/signal transduction histidine kinase